MMAIYIACAILLALLCILLFLVFSIKSSKPQVRQPEEQNQVEETDAVWVIQEKFDSVEPA